MVISLQLESSNVQLCQHALHTRWLSAPLPCAREFNCRVRAPQLLKDYVELETRMNRGHNMMGVITQA